MQGIQSLFGEQATAITLVLIVLGLALALVLLFWVFRKIATGNALRASRNRQPRLSVTDAAVVDDKRRLVLVRRDTVEHLVMIGGPSDIVIEQNISQTRPPATMKPLDRPVESQAVAETAIPQTPAEPAAVAAAAAAAAAAQISEQAASAEPDPAADGGATETASLAEPVEPAPAEQGTAPDRIELDLTELAQELEAADDAPKIDQSLQTALTRELEAEKPEVAAQAEVSETAAMESALAGIEEVLAEDTPATVAAGSEAGTQAAEITPPEASAGKKDKDSKTEVERLLDELSRA